jgi:hypothetical protein
MHGRITFLNHLSFFIEFVVITAFVYNVIRIFTMNKVFMHATWHSGHERAVNFTGGPYFNTSLLVNVD